MGVAYYDQYDWVYFCISSVYLINWVWYSIFNMSDTEILILAELLVKFHNSITKEKSSFYGENMDKALCRDALSALVAQAGKMPDVMTRVCEIGNKFTK